MNILIYKCRRCGTLIENRQQIGPSSQPETIDHECNDNKGYYGIADLIGYDDQPSIGTAGDALGVEGQKLVSGDDERGIAINILDKRIEALENNL